MEKEKEMTIFFCIKLEKSVPYLETKGREGEQILICQEPNCQEINCLDREIKYLRSAREVRRWIFQDPHLPEASPAPPPEGVISRSSLREVIFGKENEGEPEDDF